MRKMNLLRNLFLGSLILFSQVSWAADAPILKSIPDQTAVMGGAFTYTVEALLGDPAPSYELTLTRPGMIINPSTGAITWTPTSIQHGGLVTVRAWNSEGEHSRTFKIYVADELDPDPDIVSYWKMDDASSTYFIDAVGGYNATSLTPVTSAAGMVGNAIELAPPTVTTNYLSVTHNPNHGWERNEDFTISLWFKHSGGQAGVNEVILGKGSLEAWKSNIMIYLDKSGAQTMLKFQIKPKDNSTDFYEFAHSTPISTDIWYHVVAVYDGENFGTDVTMKLYLNRTKAQNVATLPDASIAGDPFDPLCIGYWDGYGTRFPFAGNLDDIIIYDKMLSDGEITDLYNDGVTGIAQHPKPGNFAPIFASDPVTTATEDVLYSYATVVSDYENEGLDLSPIILPSWLNLNTGTGLLHGTPSDSNIGDTVVSLQVDDGTTITFQNFTLNVANVNDAPAITSTPSANEINEGEEFTYTVVAEDGDPGDVITLDGLIIPDWMTFTPATGVLSGTPTNDQVMYSADSTFTISIEARDSEDLTDVQTFDLKVINVNDAPVVISQSDLSTDRDVAIDISIDDITYEDVDNRPADHTLSILDGANYTYDGLTLTPSDYFYGPLVVKMELSDGTDAVAFDLDVTVNFVNIAPEFTSTPVTTAKEGSIYTYAVVVEDPDTEDDIAPQTLSIVGLDLPHWLNLDANSLVLAGQPDRAGVGLNNVRIDISDGIDTSSHEFVIDVELTNQKPIITSSPLAAINNYLEYSYTITAVDGDATDVLTFSAVTIPAWMSFNPETATLSGIPLKMDVGTHDVLLAVSDGWDVVEQPFTITVNNVDAAPQVSSIPLDSINVPQQYAYRVVASDPEGATLSYEATTRPSWLIFDASTKILTGKAEKGMEGDHPVVIEISDGVNTTLHQFTITVHPQWPVGIENEISLAGNIYPNPANDYVIFELNSREVVNIEILDLSGRQVVLERTDGSSRFTVDVAHLQSGLYMYRVIQGDQMQAGKIVIE